MSSNSAAANSAPLSAARVILPGEMVGDRYRIVRLLGQEGLGRTYLAEDTFGLAPSASPEQGSDKICVLKEFAPQISSFSGFDWEKAQLWFSQKAALLCHLDHPNLAKFRALVRQEVEGWHCWFMVQDYVEGRTYRAWLQDCQQRGQTLSEREVVGLLRQMLSVLDYLQGQGLGPKVVSPDLILRRGDDRPVLVDFGGVKQVAAQPGEACGDQNGGGTNVDTNYLQSALYTLGTTALMLLSGLDSRMLIDPKTRQETWSLSLSLSLQPGLAKFLGQIVAQRPGDRYASAAIALQSLNHLVPPTAEADEPDFVIDFPVPWAASPRSAQGLQRRVVETDAKASPGATGRLSGRSRSRIPNWFWEKCAIGLLALLGLTGGLAVGLGWLPPLPTDSAGRDGRR